MEPKKWQRVMVGIVPPQDASAEVAIGMIDELDYFNRDEGYGPLWMGEKEGYYMIRGDVKEHKRKDLRSQHYVSGVWDDTAVGPM